MASLAKVVDVELVLLRAITDPAEVASVQFALQVVSQAVRTYTGQLLSRVDDDVITLTRGRGRLIFLPELPVISVSEVRENGTVLTVDTDYKLIAHGVLVRQYRAWGWWSGLDYVENVQVTYTHGWDPIPDDIVGVVARAASRLFQAGLRAEETSGVLGIASKSLGDFSVSYTAEGTAEGSMGASGARVLSLSEKDMLNAYKL